MRMANSPAANRTTTSPRIFPIRLAMKTLPFVTTNTAKVLLRAATPVKQAQMLKLSRVRHAKGGVRGMRNRCPSGCGRPQLGGGGGTKFSKTRPKASSASLSEGTMKSSPNFSEKFSRISQRPGVSVQGPISTT